MGSGKSTIGRLLAEATGWRYVDNDDLVNRATGMTSRALVAARGEESMRDAERAAAEQALAEAVPVIVGIAGGAITDEATRRAIADAGFVVWLRAGATALERWPWAPSIGRGRAGRVGWLATTATERAGLYESVADLTVDTDRRGPKDVVGRILAAIATLEGCPSISRP